MAAPAPDPAPVAEDAPAPAAAAAAAETAPAPALPPPQKQDNYTRLVSVCCPYCHRVTSAALEDEGRRVVYTCPSNDEHANQYQKIVLNPQPENYLVPELKKALVERTHEVVNIGCPDTQCGGTKCTLYKVSDGNGLKEFLVCHTCAEYWRAA